jgi:Mg2+ and Co2+ transporter CorA
MIASIYGMNINLPGQQLSNAWLFILVLIFGGTLAGFIFFRKNKWL